MLTSGGMRSSALARAQAQLSGQRIPMGPKDSNEELQEYMSVLNKKTTVLKQQQAPLPGLSDLSDGSIDNSETHRHTVAKETGKLLEATAVQSRFLKKKQHAEEHRFPPYDRTSSRNDNRPSQNLTRMGPSTAKSSTALRKFADLENKIRSRQLEAEPSDVDSDPRTSDERPFSVRSSSDFSGRGSLLIRKVELDSSRQGKEVEDLQKVNASHTNQMKELKKTDWTMESEEEEIKRLIGSSMDFSDENESWGKLLPNNLSLQAYVTKSKRTPSLPTKGSPRRTLHHSASFHTKGSLQRVPSRLSSRTPSPPSRGIPRPYRRARSLSKSPLSSARSSLANNSSPRIRLVKRSHTPLSARSDLKSLDELFSRASVVDDVASDSSTEFKVNILSLDDLAPNTLQDSPNELEKEQKETKEKTTAKVQTKVINPPSRDTNKVHRHSIEKSVDLGSRAARDADSASEIQTETDDDVEISEHLNVDSTPRARIRFSGPERTLSVPSESTARSAYSDDFEKSTHTAVSQDTDSEKTTTRSSRHSRHSRRGTSYSSPTTKLSAQTIASQPVKARDEGERRGPVKEASVQTNDPAFIYQWSNLGGSAVLGPALGGAYVDPVPIASYVVSPDAVEAMTAYSPAVYALNDMLREQLKLTRQFVEMSRHLHLATLNSLESEPYHYITLDETKEYIRSHKPPSLIRKQASEDVLQDMRDC